jgi:ADP-ribose pyrophosphatase YjhB (NUDIX family)
MQADDLTETQPGWLSPDELEALRGQVPIVYVDAVPVRLDEQGRVVEVGVLLRAMPDGTVSRAVVSGRVLYGETIRQALLRHITKDLGAEAQPRLPASPAPFTIVEYFPDPSITGFYDPRQHAVGLAYVVPLDGICRPSQDSLDFTWLSPEEADTKEVRAEMTGGQDRLLRLALAYTGSLA